MTTPGGVPNLPQGALTLSNLASKTQDMTPAGMRGRTNERVSSIFGASTGGDITSDLSPFGIIAAIFAGFSSLVANADPADITGPEDLPGLLLDFIESLPFVGQFVELFEAILGTYTGTDTTLLGIQTLFAPIRALVTLVPGLFSGLDLSDPSTWGPAQLVNGNAPQIVQDIIDAGTNFFTTGVLGSTTGNTINDLFSSLLGSHATGSNAQAVNVIQDAQLAAVAVGGGAVSNTETFDGAAGALNTTLWEQTYGYGSGSGTDGYNGSGRCVWVGSGVSNYGCLNRYKTATNTDTQLVQMTITSNLGGSTTGNPPSIRLQGRMNSTRTSYIEARMQDGGSGTGVAEIGIVVSSTYTRLGATASFSSPYSGTWTLKIGTTASTREFILLHDGATILSRTDTGATSVINASNRFTAFSHIAGSSFFFSPFQVAPPDVESFGSSDRLAAS